MYGKDISVLIVDGSIHNLYKQLGNNLVFLSMCELVKRLDSELLWHMYKIRIELGNPKVVL